MGQICSIKSGKSDTQDAAEDGAYAFFDRSRTIKKSSRYLYDCEALIIPGEGTEFLPKHFIGKFDLHQRAYALFDFSERIDVKFLYYFLHYYCDYFPRVAVGATVKSLRLRHFEQLPVSITCLPEQKRIVGILDEAFDGIATAKANAEKNLHNARALFESYLQFVFSQPGKSWVVKKLGDESLLEIIDGDRGVNYPKTSDFCDEGHCLFLNTKNVRPDGFDFGTTMFITAEKDRQLRKGKLTRDDVVMTTRGTIGNIGLYSEDVPFDNIRINSGMLIFRANKRTLLPPFLFELLRSEIVKDQIRKQTTGAAQPQLPIKTLVNFTIPVPTNLDDQRALIKKLRAVEPETQDLNNLYERKLTALEAFKRSLLHLAFTGGL